MMNARFLRSVVGLFCLVVAVPFSASAADGGSAWPSQGRPQLKMTHQTAMFDGMPGSWEQLEASGFKVRWFGASPWELQKAASLASLSLTYRRLPELSMQLFLYPDGVWLKDTSSASVLQYVESLPLQFPNQTVTVLNPDEYVPEVGSIPFLGQQYRQVFYQVQPVDLSDAPVEVCDYFVIFEGSLFVVRFQSTSETIARFKAKFPLELSDFSELEEE